MKSWRDGVSEETQGDVVQLINTMLELIEKHLKSQGGFIPFGVFDQIDGPGIIAMVEPDPSGDGDATIAKLEKIAVDQRDDLKVVAIAHDATIPSGDAAIIRVHHRDGPQIQLVQPYEIQRGLRRRVVLGESALMPGDLVVF